MVWWFSDWALGVGLSCKGLMEKVGLGTHPPVSIKAALHVSFIEAFIALLELHC